MRGNYVLSSSGCPLVLRGLWPCMYTQPASDYPNGELRERQPAIRQRRPPTTEWNGAEWWMNGVNAFAYRGMDMEYGGAC